MTSGDWLRAQLATGSARTSPCEVTKTWDYNARGGSMSDEIEETDIDPALLYDDDELQAWEDYQHAEEKARHEQLLSELRTIGVLSDLSDQQCGRVESAVWFARDDFGRDSSEARNAGTSWLARRARWHCHIRAVNAASQRALVAIGELTAAIEAFERTDSAVRPGISFPFLQRCRLARQVISQVALPKPTRVRRVPGRAAAKRLAKQDQERFERLFKSFKLRFLTQQESDVRSAKIINAFWGLPKKITITFDAFGNEKVEATQKARTRKRAKAATGKAPGGRPPRRPRQE